MQARTLSIFTIDSFFSLSCNSIKVSVTTSVPIVAKPQVRVAVSHCTNAVDERP